MKHGFINRFSRDSIVSIGIDDDNSDSRHGKDCSRKPLPQRASPVEPPGIFPNDQMPER